MGKSVMDEFEELLLQGSRNGDKSIVQELLLAKQEKKIDLNLNCKGRSKSNFGWTPLHLACYFGHERVAEMLLKNEADVNVVNDTGDTPLHKAAFTGRETLVILLLQHNADVSIPNGEGQLPKEVALVNDIKKLLDGAERAEVKKRETQLLQASRDGDVQVLNKLLRSSNAPNINCTDSSGNTCLHCASYREQKEVAVILLQNGIDTTVRNKRGQTAFQLARSVQMKQILDVQPIKALVRHVVRFEGHLLKRSRFLGWQNIWAVLERGVLTYFNSRADACSGVKRKGFKHLESAKVIPLEMEPQTFIIHFCDNTTHRLSLPLTPNGNGISRQIWLNALQEHIAYCTHYMNQGSIIDDSEEEQDVLPLGSLKDALQTAGAHQQLLEKQVASLTSVISGLQENNSDKPGVDSEMTNKLSQILQSSTAVVNSLHHCMVIFTQQEEVRQLQLKQEQERCRVLEDALHVLAREHHELEQSIGNSPFQTPKSSQSPRVPRFYDTSDDEFYDAFGESPDEAPIMDVAAGADKDTQDFLREVKEPVEDELTKIPTEDKRSLINTLRVTLSGREGTGSRNPSRSSSPLKVKTSPPPNNKTAAKIKDTPKKTPPIEAVKSNAQPIDAESEEEPVEAQHVTDEPPTHTDKVKKQSMRKKSEKKKRTVTYTPRTILPAPMFARNDYSVWSILKQCIGKELSKITMPIIFNEPLSFLQRMSEYMEYSYLLRNASNAPTPVERMEYVMAFAVSGLASNWDRLGKPFNPLLGETYELRRDDFQVICEQVSHHPPISAFYTEAPLYVFHGSIHPKLKFWGKSLEIQPKGVVTLILTKHKEAYTWSYVNCCIHNIIVGNLWIEQYGVMEIQCHKTGYKGILNFKPAGWFNKDLHKLEGHIIDKNKKKLRHLYGKWTEYLFSVDMDSYNEFIQKNPFYLSSQSTVSENQQIIPPTSSTTQGTPTKSPKKSAAVKPTTNGHGSSSSANSEAITLSPYIEVPNSVLLWKVSPRPSYAPEYHQFTLFTMSLNEMEPGMEKCLPATDCRLRPDIRKLEEGDIDGAGEEKTRLEEKQRDARKYRKKDKSAWKPMWFKNSVNPYTNEEDWIYTGGYWERRFQKCPDIF